MKKIVFIMPLFLIILFSSACGVETAAKHNERLQEEAESASIEIESSSESTTELSTESTIETSTSAEAIITSDNNSVQTTTSASIPKVNVTINIKSDELSEASATFSYSYNIQVNEGTTAFDATKLACAANSIPINIKQTSINGYYIKMINNLWEKYTGYPGSGWIWNLNGSFASTLASNYVLKSGDVITWEYSIEIDPDEGM